MQLAAQFALAQSSKLVSVVDVAVQRSTSHTASMGSSETHSSTELHAVSFTHASVSAQQLVLMHVMHVSSVTLGALALDPELELLELDELLEEDVPSPHASAHGPPLPVHIPSASVAALASPHI